MKLTFDTQEEKDQALLKASEGSNAGNSAEFKALLAKAEVLGGESTANADKKDEEVDESEDESEGGEEGAEELPKKRGKKK